MCLHSDPSSFLIFRVAIWSLKMIKCFSFIQSLQDLVEAV